MQPENSSSLTLTIARTPEVASLRTFALASAVLCAILFFAAFASTSLEPELATYGDKVLHVVVSAMLYVLLKPVARSRVATLLAVLAVGLGKETLIDPYISGPDMLANWIGCMVGLFLA